jgi:GNAT superfamily N-acetyltransferase
MSRIGNPGCRRLRRFSSPPVRRQRLCGRTSAPFKERLLGRYIAYDIESFFVAITEVSTVAGYLAGCLDNPAHNPRFADHGYYASFAPLCDRYPCHLHINLDERYRNRGTGSALIAAFAAQAASARRSGIHVVTGERARNVRFYEKNEFRPLATVRWNGADAVFMGRLLPTR